MVNNVEPVVLSECTRCLMDDLADKERYVKMLENIRWSIMLLNPNCSVDSPDWDIAGEDSDADVTTIQGPLIKSLAVWKIQKNAGSTGVIEDY